MSKTNIEDRSISICWCIRLSALFLALLVFEVVRLAARINIVELAGTSGIYTNVLTIILISASLILTLARKKLAPFLLIFVLAINFFTSTLYPNEAIGSLTSSFSEIVGMPEFLFYAYMILQIAIAVTLAIYYFTDHLYGDERKVRIEPRDVMFSDFLKETAAKKDVENDAIWDN